jgi:suppressor of G2 allele of SKP1
MEELLISACKDYINDNIDSSIEKLGKLIELNSENLMQQALLYRATAYRRIGKYQNSLEDLENLLNMPKERSQIDSFEMFFKLGQVNFDLEKYEESYDFFKKALNLSSNEEQRQKLIICMNKTNLELNETNMGNNPNSISSCSSNTIDINKSNNNLNSNNSIKFIHNWFQNSTHITINFDCSVPLNNNDYKIRIEKKLIQIINNTNNTPVLELNLCNGVIPDESTSYINNRKVEIKLKKEVENFQWVTLEKQNSAVNITSNGNLQGFKPTYPTSSKVKKDWDNIDKEITRELDKEDIVGNDAMMKLFKQIYERGDENTRRAMIKSFQTSGGTVLSTNWGEVKEKEYDGKDRPTAPDGQEWADKVNQN